MKSVGFEGSGDTSIRPVFAAGGDPFVLRGLKVMLTGLKVMLSDSYYGAFMNSGRSDGVAKVVFIDPAHAQMAYDQYNKVALDGQAMKITIHRGKPQPQGRMLSSGLRCGHALALLWLGPQHFTVRKPGATASATCNSFDGHQIVSDSVSARLGFPCTIAVQG